jgi:hypothetical protein
MPTPAEAFEEPLTTPSTDAGSIGGMLEPPVNRHRERAQKEAVTRIVREFIEIKYELSNYVDDGLIELGEQFDKAITKLIEATGTGSLIDESIGPDQPGSSEDASPAVVGDVPPSQ